MFIAAASSQAAGLLSFTGKLVDEWMIAVYYKLGLVMSIICMCYSNIVLTKDNSEIREHGGSQCNKDQSAKKQLHNQTSWRQTQSSAEIIWKRKQN